MSQNPDARTKLTRLADALIEEIIATPDAETIAEIGKEEIERTRALLGRAKMAKAKSDLGSWKDGQSRGGAPIDRAEPAI